MRAVADLRLAKLSKRKSLHQADFLISRSYLFILPHAGSIFHQVVHLELVLSAVEHEGVVSFNAMVVVGGG